MKIMQSKFYEPRKLIGLRGESPHVLTEFDDASFYRSKYAPFEALLDDILSPIPVGNASLVLAKTQLGDFERCTDFVTVKYDKEENSVMEKELCFYHEALEIFFLSNKEQEHPLAQLILDSDKLTSNRITDPNLLQITRIFYDPTNPKALDNVQTFFDTYVQKYESNDATVSILLKEPYGLTFKSHSVTPYPIDLNLMYNDDFLPVHQHIKQALTEDKKGVVLLHGIPGSGKTNYIKWLTSQIPSKQFIFVPTHMISSLTSPDFISLLVDNKNSVLVLEDCENYIAERTADNRNSDMVTTILNIADGILSDILECQFICTFNSDISKIDDALLRKGRLIAEYKFKELEVDKACAYLKHQQALKLEAKEDSDKADASKELPHIDAPISLAELTNLEADHFKEDKTEKKIGFV